MTESINDDTTTTIPDPAKGPAMTTPTSDRSPTLQAAVDELATAMEALEMRARLQLATETLAAGGVNSKQAPVTRPFWLAMYSLTNGATAERLDHLVSTLETGGPELRQMLVIVARRAVAGDPPRADVWRALQHLADAVVE